MKGRRCTRCSATSRTAASRSFSKPNHETNPEDINMVMEKVWNIARRKTDPKVVSTGPSSFSASDRMARNLGWFSFGLGALEIFAPERITRALGMEGQESLVRAYGFREVAAGMLSLSVEKKAGLWSRVAGGGVRVATLMA